MGQLTLTQNTVVDTPAAGAVILANKAGALISKDYLGNEKSLVNNKNAIINPLMDIWQRNTTFTGLANPTSIYSADRWNIINVTSAGVVRVDKDTSVPTVAQAGILLTSSLKMQITTLDASVLTSEYLGIRQTIEGYNWRYLAQRAMTFSFWINCNRAGTYSVAFNNSGADRAFVAEYVISAADVVAGWVKKIINISASPSAGTWNYTNGIGCKVDFGFAIGSNYQGSANGSWNTVSGVILGTSNCSNFCDNVANIVYITGVQLELGNAATELEFISFQQLIALCQRYYSKSYDLDVVPGTASVRGFSTLKGMATNSATTFSDFPVIMRTVPTVVLYSFAGTINKIFNLFAGTTIGTTCAATGLITARRFDAVTDSGSGLTSGNDYGAHWTAESEL